ncbi:MAG: glutamate--tRNA ligase [Candidatus Bathyarchaeota archaeon]|nr:MAG: glutamate--tRNA ligase [Candidatus Bathyarchaeota archaeon]
MSFEDELKERIKKIALLNAVNFQGKARQEPVVGKLLAEMPQLKAKIKDITPIVAKIVEDVNNMDLPEQKMTVQRSWPETLIRKKMNQQKELSPLPNVDKNKVVVTRFSPNPDAPIHLGSSRAIILCHEYAKIYDGKFLVRFEDTDPKLKRPQLMFYDQIKRDLEWLDCEPDKYFIQSDRLAIYYNHAEWLLKEGHAYVCTCKSEVFKKLILTKKPCPCRGFTPQEQMRRWHNMLDGTYQEGEAVVRIKTDLTHPNPAVRDWPALRIIDTEKHRHPRVGSKYRVWPLYNLACGIDDHLMGITHIIRGKEHLTNQVRQEYMYDYFGWIYPEAIHYGRLKIAGAYLSKSKIMQGIREGIYKSWDDPRLATFFALRLRGIQPDAIRQLIIDVGPKSQDITLSWENLYAHNRKIIEPKANRYFFVANPLMLVVKGITHTFTAEIPSHPDHPERGSRKFDVQPSEGITKFWIATKDAENMEEGQVIRLMELFNIMVENTENGVLRAAFHSQRYDEARKVKAPLIHWIPENRAVRCHVVMPDASVVQRLAEESFKRLQNGTIAQFERFGFIRVDSNKEGLLQAYYCHR